jgi:hypothetical protein
MLVICVHFVCGLPIYAFMHLKVLVTRVCYIFWKRQIRSLNCLISFTEMVARRAKLDLKWKSTFFGPSNICVNTLLWWVCTVFRYKKPSHSHDLLGGANNLFLRTNTQATNSSRLHILYCRDNHLRTVLQDQNKYGCHQYYCVTQDRWLLSVLDNCHYLYGAFSRQRCELYKEYRYICPVRN